MSNNATNPTSSSDKVAEQERKMRRDAREVLGMKLNYMLHLFPAKHELASLDAVEVTRRWEARIWDETKELSYGNVDADTEGYNDTVDYEVKELQDWDGSWSTIFPGSIWTGAEEFAGRVRILFPRGVETTTPPAVVRQEKAKTQLAAPKKAQRREILVPRSRKRQGQVETAGLSSPSYPVGETWEQETVVGDDSAAIAQEEDGLPQCAVGIQTPFCPAGLEHSNLDEEIFALAGGNDVAGVGYPEATMDNFSSDASVDLDEEIFALAGGYDVVAGVEYPEAIMADSPPFFDAGVDVSNTFQPMDIGFNTNVDFNVDFDFGFNVDVDFNFENDVEFSTPQPGADFAFADHDMSAPQDVEQVLDTSGLDELFADMDFSMDPAFALAMDLDVSGAPQPPCPEAAMTGLEEYTPVEACQDVVEMELVAPTAPQVDVAAPATATPAQEPTEPLPAAFDVAAWTPEVLQSISFCPAPASPCSTEACPSPVCAEEEHSGEEDVGARERTEEVPAVPWHGTVGVQAEEEEACVPEAVAHDDGYMEPTTAKSPPRGTTIVAAPVTQAAGPAKQASKPVKAPKQKKGKKKSPSSRPCHLPTPPPSPPTPSLSAPLEALQASWNENLSTRRVPRVFADAAQYLGAQTAKLGEEHTFLARKRASLLAQQWEALQRASDSFARLDGDFSNAAQRDSHFAARRLQESENWGRGYGRMSLRCGSQGNAALADKWTRMAVGRELFSQSLRRSAEQMLSGIVAHYRAYFDAVQFLHLGFPSSDIQRALGDLAGVTLADYRGRCAEVHEAFGLAMEPLSSDVS